MLEAKGKRLDKLAYTYGIKRRRKFLFIKEKDDGLRERCIQKNKGRRSG